jgi:dTDP-4-dehydrorhamnose reductase
MTDAKHLPCGERILLTGAGGQVGFELTQSLATLGEVVAPGRAEMDMADVDCVRRTIRNVRPRWIVNAAGYTAVDRAESERDLAFAVNAAAVQGMGEEARDLGASVIHFSTDYVFDGTATKPYEETDPTGPVSVYGESKLAGERALAESGAGHMIFRTSWVYGSRGKNFLLTILKLAREREELRVVADQHGAPTWSRDLARLAVHAIGRCEMAADGGALGDVLRDLGGVYHAAGAGETSWYGFAVEAVRAAKERESETRFADIEPIATAEYPTAAQRPANSRLDCSRLAERLGWKMMEWHASLGQVVSEL